MPFVLDEFRWDLACGRGADGHWWGWITVSVAAHALWRLGLHPEQPTARVNGASPPGWWHAAGERYAYERWPSSGPEAATRRAV
ncbi:hypothetical protein OG762_31485 [Streptomyces sp. NBC_01136]|uniref:hypothetical protein n=1 Tax=Streptomyces sp. NBC_01136 TaxID=2903754 RepID=UPI0038656AA8|nr:hypothetical protein OG762_31485 [Streptomyces sp. NBC_01136]